MALLSLFFLWISLVPGVRGESVSMGLRQGQVWGDQGPSQQRKLLQGAPEAFRMTAGDCNPQLQDCQDMEYMMSLDGCNPYFEDCSMEQDQEQEECQDVQPPGIFTCSEIVQSGWCGDIQNEYCAVSCNFCCFDEQPSDFINCTQIAKQGQCQRVLEDGKCRKTCGACSAVLTGASLVALGKVTAVVVGNITDIAEDLTNIADAIDTNRTVAFTISNNTHKLLKLLGTYIESGEFISVPSEIQPYTSVTGGAQEKWGVYGVEGCMVYQWEDERERIAMYLLNLQNGSNLSGIQYYWETYVDLKWYFDNVPYVNEGEVMSTTINNWFTIQSYITDANKASAVFTLETF